MDELLPALDARLEPGSELADALRAALAGTVAPIPLDAPPLDQTTHALEIHVAGVSEPLVLLAEPAGVSREGRFPLRLAVLDDAQRAVVGKLLTACESAPPAAAASEPFLGRAFGGKYRVEKLLGAGSVGRVYRAAHLGLARAVAVKVLHPFFASAPDFIERFHEEARTASRLDHPNLTRVLDFGQEPDGTLYLVMEYLEGPTLEQLVEREGPLEPERAVHLMMQVCAALSVAHDAGVVHRDIKPENVVVIPGRNDDGSPAEIVKVCDFGIAQLQEESRPGAAGQICGSPAYMSPEQGRGEFLDARSDVYACGVTLFQLLTGRVPFEADDLRELLLQHATELPRRPSELRSAVGLRLDRIVLKCLAKEREDRFPSARELRAALIGLEEPSSSQPVLELEEFVSLGDERAGLARLLLALGAYLFERGKDAPRALVEAASQTLRFCGELTFARGPNDGPMVVLTGAGEMSPIADIVRRDLAARTMGMRLDSLFRSTKVLALTLRTGIDEIGLSALHPLTPGVPVRPSRPTLSVSVLRESERLGQRLPWVVELTVTRLAHDLGLVWGGATMDLATKRDWRARILREELRSVESAGALLVVLEQGPLVEARVPTALEGRSFAERVLEALPWSRCIAVAEILLGDQPLTISRSTVVALATRIAREQSNEAEGLLRDLRAKNLLAWADLPAEAQDWLRGSEGAALLSRAPQSILGGLIMLDDRSLLRELGWIRHAIPLAVRRGDAAAGRAVFTALTRMRRDGGTSERQTALAEALAAFERPEVLRALAETLLFGGDATQREAARLLLAGVEGTAETLVRVATSLRAQPRPSGGTRGSLRKPGR